MCVCVFDRVFAKAELVPLSFGQARVNLSKGEVQIFSKLECPEGCTSSLYRANDKSKKIILFSDLVLNVLELETQLIVVAQSTDPSIDLAGSTAEVFTPSGKLVKQVLLDSSGIGIVAKKELQGYQKTNLIWKIEKNGQMGLLVNNWTHGFESWRHPIQKLKNVARVSPASRHVPRILLTRPYFKPGDFIEFFVECDSFKDQGKLQFRHVETAAKFEVNLNCRRQQSLFAFSIPTNADFHLGKYDLYHINAHESSAEFMEQSVHIGNSPLAVDLKIKMSEKLINGSENSLQVEILDRSIDFNKTKVEYRFQMFPLSCGQMNRFGLAELKDFIQCQDVMEMKQEDICRPNFNPGLIWTSIAKLDSEWKSKMKIPTVKLCGQPVLLLTQVRLNSGLNNSDWVQQMTPLFPTDSLVAFKDLGLVDGKRKIQIKSRFVSGDPPIGKRDVDFVLEASQVNVTQHLIRNFGLDYGNYTLPRLIGSPTLICKAELTVGTSQNCEFSGKPELDFLLTLKDSDKNVFEALVSSEHSASRNFSRVNSRQMYPNFAGEIENKGEKKISLRFDNQYRNSKLIVVSESGDRVFSDVFTLLDFKGVVEISKRTLSKSTRFYFFLIQISADIPKGMNSSARAESGFRFGVTEVYLPEHKSNDFDFKFVKVKGQKGLRVDFKASEHLEKKKANFYKVGYLLMPKELLGEIQNDSVEKFVMRNDELFFSLRSSSMKEAQSRSRATKNQIKGTPRPVPSIGNRNTTIRMTNFGVLSAAKLPFLIPIPDNPSTDLVALIFVMSLENKSFSLTMAGVGAEQVFENQVEPILKTDNWKVTSPRTEFIPPRMSYAFPLETESKIISKNEEFLELKRQQRPSDLLVLDQDSYPLATFRQDFQRRFLVWADLPDFSNQLVNFVLQSEDQTFFENSGVDWGALLSAATQRALDGPESTRGGASTISMQLVGLMGQVPRSGQRSFVDKAQQIKLAMQLETKWSKQEILEAYLNLVPMRGEVVGVPTASLLFFEKPAADLNELEAACLAVMIRSPNASKERLSERMRLLLPGREAKEINLFIEKALTAKKVGYDQNFVLDQNSSLGEKSNQVIKTSIQRSLQTRARGLLESHLQKYKSEGLTDAAVIILDNKTGKTLAYIGNGGATFSSNDKVDHIAQYRQAGSALKPMLFAAAFEKGLFKSNSLILDETFFEMQKNGLVFSPRNATHQNYGLVSIGEALGNSLNTTAVKTLQRLGRSYYKNYLNQNGFLTPDYDSSFGSSAALGTISITLNELSQAFLRIAVPSSLKDSSRFKLIDILSDDSFRRFIYGTDQHVAFPFDVAVKTGTSSLYRDSWSVGFTSEHTIGVWTGRSGTGLPSQVGSANASYLWREIISSLYREKSPQRLLTTKRTSEMSNGEVVLRGDLESSVFEFPKNGMHFAIDPNLDLKRQRVPIFLKGGYEKVSVQHNGKEVELHDGIHQIDLVFGENTIVLQTESQTVLEKIRIYLD